MNIRTDHPLALDSVDHLVPRGTMRDSSVSPAFNRKLFAFGVPSVLDLGCAGGGMVESILNDGGLAVGVEGSDYSRKAQRAAWGTIPDSLFTADITQPFTIYDRRGLNQWFTVITAWEFFEHIPEERLAKVFHNIERHLSRDGGLLIVSIATIPDEEDGHSWHPTIQPQEWWLDVYKRHGYRLDATLTDYFDPDWVRGPVTGNTSSLCGVFRRTRQGQPSARGTLAAE